MSKHPTIAEHLEASGVSRRSFLQLCSVLMATAPVGLALTGKGSVLQVAEAIGKTKRPSVIWLHFQDCMDAPKLCCAPPLPMLLT